MVDRKETPDRPTNIADKLFQIRAEKPALKNHWLLAQSTTNLAAGVETLGVTISTLVNFAISHPGCLAKIQREIDEARVAGKLSKIPKFKEMDSLAYLNACINEVKRLHPVVGM